jgi:sulfate transport system substrate-binding protein
VAIVSTRVCGLAWLVLLLAPACGGEPAVESAVSPVRETSIREPILLRFAAFSTVREAYEKRIVPRFVESWRRTRGQEVRFVQSYGASGTQARAIVEQFEADVAALSNAEDVETLVAAGLVREPWAWGDHAGIVSRSAVVLAVRPGNPKGIADWNDLARTDCDVLMPDPTSSGGGRWGVVAMYGAALREDPGPGAAARAEQRLADVFSRVVRWSPDARASFQAFEAGVGDVAVTSESEVMHSRMFGHEIEWVVPPSTLRIDNPAVLVDAHVDRHGTREVARAFVEYLVTEEAQRAFALRGIRPVDPSIEIGEREEAGPNAKAWGIETLGGWGQVTREIFTPGGVLDRARSAARRD